MPDRLTLSEFSAKSGAPQDYYFVLGGPTPLAGMRYPNSQTPWKRLYEAGLRKVVCLATEEPDYDPSPLQIEHAVCLQDLVEGGEPQNSEKEWKEVQQAVEIVAACLASGEGVLVHCQGGRGRTGTVIGGAMLWRGFKPSDIIVRLNEIHKQRGKLKGWPESPWQSGFIKDYADQIGAWHLGHAYLNRVIFTGIRGTLIHHETGEQIRGMDHLLCDLSSSGWRIVIVTSYSDSDARQLLSDFRSPIHSVISTSNGQIKYSAITKSFDKVVDEVGGLVRLVYFDDNLENLAPIVEATVDRPQPIGFAGSGKYEPALRQFCRERGIGYAASADELRHAIGQWE